MEAGAQGHRARLRAPESQVRLAAQSARPDANKGMALMPLRPQLMLTFTHTASCQVPSVGLALERQSASRLPAGASGKAPPVCMAVLTDVELSPPSGCVALDQSG